MRKISSSLDGDLQAEEHRELERHLSRCPECTLHFRQLGKLRNTVRALPARTPPWQLTAALRVIASRERLIRLRRASLSRSVQYWSEIARLWVHNLVRPRALPFAGGVTSAVLLFSILAPMYGVEDRSSARDVPTALATKAAFKRALSFGLSDNDIVVDVLVDGQGRMLDYSIPRGQAWGSNPELRRSIENALLCTEFTPATMFGQPASGKLRITLRRNEIEVRG